MTVHVTQLHSAVFQLLITCTAKLTFIILCAPGFRCLCVTLGSRWKSIFCVSISYSFNYVPQSAATLSHLPFIVIPQPIFSALQGMPSLSAHCQGLCKTETTEYRNKPVIHLLMPYVTFSMQGELHWWPNSQCAVFLQHTGQLLITSSEFNIRGLIKPSRWANWEVTMQLKNTQFQN
jgi:hypothetical protein